MLVLSRDSGEAVILTLPNGEEIRILVGRASKGVARLIFDAPQSVKILREELKGVPRRTNDDN